MTMSESTTLSSSSTPSHQMLLAFDSDLAAKTLPQWSFITPNMTNDGHDTTVTFAANWSRTFLEPLLNNTYFMDNTLIVLTFDEVETYNVTNKVFTILLGGAIPTTRNYRQHLL